MSVYHRLAELGITLPPVATPAAAYVPFVQTGKLVFLSGHIAKKDGKPWVGQLGRDMDTAIDREAARAIARAMPGVRSANWIDRHNLLVRVDGAPLRSQQTIDDLCIRLEPLGDTLAVVVHLQNAAARTHDDMDTLSRNCQLAPGDNAFMQRPRTIDALDPAIRAQQRAYREHAGAQPVQQQSAGDRAALEAMKEM